MYAEDLDVFLADFADTCVAGAVTFKAIVDQPDELLDVQRVTARSREYLITYRSDAVTLARDAAVTITEGRAAGSYTVREAPRLVRDGAFSTCLLSHT